MPQPIGREDRRTGLIDRRLQRIGVAGGYRPRTAVGQPHDKPHDAPPAPERRGHEQLAKQGVRLSYDSDLARQDRPQLLQSVAISSGLGKTYLACALADRALRRGHTALYRRVPKLVFELALARADGSYLKALERIARVELLLLDDWGLAQVEGQAANDLMDVVDDRAGVRSTVIASQLPVGDWHHLIADPSIADAVLDRLVHRSVRIELTGESLRKRRPNKEGGLT